jgi:xylan 1,4-beta-xylosidase
MHLGRETAIQRMKWCDDDGCGRQTATVCRDPRLTLPALPPHVSPQCQPAKIFDHVQLPVDFQWLRSPWPDELS